MKQLLIHFKAIARTEKAQHHGDYGGTGQRGEEMSVFTTNRKTHLNISYLRRRETGLIYSHPTTQSVFLVRQVTLKFGLGSR